MNVPTIGRNRSSEKEQAAGQLNSYARRSGGDAAEILSVDLLDSHRTLADDFRAAAERLGIQLGWHYPLDLTWIASQLGDPNGMRILDAGAGTGVMQWWLAERGAHVISVDRVDRAELSGRFRMAYRVSGFAPGDLLSPPRVMLARLRDSSKSLPFRLKGALRAAVTWILAPILPKARGSVTLLKVDLDDLSPLPDNAFDAVVAVSALEHNDANHLVRVVEELLRVLKPGAPLLATLAAARDRDWYHEPSRGWCFTEKTLAATFGLTPQWRSNYSDFEPLFERIRASAELRENLAPMFFESGDNGMPWGIWDPKYQPVGILKWKPLA